MIVVSDRPHVPKITNQCALAQTLCSFRTQSATWFASACWILCFSCSIALSCVEPSRLLLPRPELVSPAPPLRPGCTYPPDAIVGAMGVCKARANDTPDKTQRASLRQEHDVCLWCSFSVKSSEILGNFRGSKKVQIIPEISTSSILRTLYSGRLQKYIAMYTKP